MSRQVVLFAGLHKTGSTSIQNTCARNQRVLRNAGFLYPVLSHRGQKFTNHTSTLRYMFRRDPQRRGYLRQYSEGSEAEAIAHRNNLREAMSSQLLNRSANILIAAEGVSLFTTVELNETKSWFNDRGCDIRIICYVRRLSGWISSMVSQRVTHERLSIAAAVGEFLETSGIVRDRIENIRSVFPDAKFYSYEVALQHRFGPVGFFFDAIGIGQPEEISFVKANEGRSDFAIRLLSSINEALGPRIIDGHPNRRYADNHISALQTIPGPKFSLQLDEVSQLMPKLRTENEWLKETLGEEFYDQHPQFSNGPCAWTQKSLGRLEELSKTSSLLVRSLIASYLAGLETTSAGTP